jgi:peptidoglycan/LPS O-acetylase OafA/YrhL
VATTSTRPITARQEQLDVVRGVAILGVLATHSNYYVVAHLPPSALLHWRPLVDTLDAGGYGVDLFFFLSGWLLARIYRGTEHSSRAYWARRIARLWPLWLLFLMLGVFEYKLLGASDPPFGSLGRLAGPGAAIFHSGWPWPLALVASATFLGWLSPILWNGAVLGGWSIQAEMGHYVLFPSLNKRPILRALCFVALGYLSYVACRLGLHFWRDVPALGAILRGWIRLGLYGTFPYFVTGVVASTLAARHSDWSIASIRSEARGHGRFLAAAFSLGIVALFIPLPFGRSYLAPFALLVLLGISVIIGRMDRVARFVARLGFYSYFVYFCHFFVLQFSSKVIGSGLRSHGWGSGVLVYPVSILLNFVCALFISMGLGALSYRYIERPIINRARDIH